MIGETIVADAQPRFGNGMTMPGSGDNTSPVSQRLVQPEINGRESETENTNLIVEMAAMPYGGKSFTGCGPEGHGFGNDPPAYVRDTE